MYNNDLDKSDVILQSQSSAEVETQQAQPSITTAIDGSNPDLAFKSIEASWHQLTEAATAASGQFSPSVMVPQTMQNLNNNTAANELDPPTFGGHSQMPLSQDPVERTEHCYQLSPYDVQVDKCPNTEGLQHAKGFERFYTGFERFLQRQAQTTEANDKTHAEQMKPISSKFGLLPEAKVDALLGRAKVKSPIADQKKQSSLLSRTVTDQQSQGSHPTQTLWLDHPLQDFWDDADLSKCSPEEEKASVMKILAIAESIELNPECLLTYFDGMYNHVGTAYKQSYALVHSNAKVNQDTKAARALNAKNRGRFFLAVHWSDELAFENFLNGQYPTYVDDVSIVGVRFIWQEDFDKYKLAAKHLTTEVGENEMEYVETQGPNGQKIVSKQKKVPQPIYLHGQEHEDPREHCKSLIKDHKKKLSHHKTSDDQKAKLQARIDELERILAQHSKFYYVKVKVEDKNFEKNVKPDRTFWIPLFAFMKESRRALQFFEYCLKLVNQPGGLTPLAYDALFSEGAGAGGAAYQESKNKELMYLNDDPNQVLYDSASSHYRYLKKEHQYLLQIPVEDEPSPEQRELNERNTPEKAARALDHFFTLVNRCLKDSEQIPLSLQRDLERFYSEYQQSELSFDNQMQVRMVTTFRIYHQENLYDGHQLAERPQPSNDAPPFWIKPIIRSNRICLILAINTLLGACVFPTVQEYLSHCGIGSDPAENLRWLLKQQLPLPPRLIIEFNDKPMELKLVSAGFMTKEPYVEKWNKEKICYYLHHQCRRSRVLVLCTTGQIDPRKVAVHALVLQFNFEDNSWYVINPNKSKRESAIRKLTYFDEIFSSIQTQFYVLCECKEGKIVQPPTNPDRPHPYQTRLYGLDEESKE